MIYLAILLVLTGLLILLIALFSESQKANYAGLKGSSYTPSAGSTYAGGIEPEDVDIIFPDSMVDRETISEDDVFVNFDQNKSFNEDTKPIDSQDWDFNESEQDDFIPDSGPLTEISDAGSSKVPAEEQIKGGVPLHDINYDSSVYAVLFDDRSNLINYNSAENFIETSISGYSNIKRIGRGKVQVDDDGVSFNMDEKFYRFDFYKVHDVWSGPGFIALPLKGGSSVKLFMIEGAPDFPDRVELYFQEYVKVN